MQRDVDHVAVGIELRHFHPVAQSNHVVAGYLYTGNEGQYRVLEHQHQDRCHGADAAHENQRVLIHERGNDYHGAQHVHDNLGDLEVAFDRAALGNLELPVDVVGRGEESPDRQCHHGHDECRSQALNESFYISR